MTDRRFTWSIRALLAAPYLVALVVLASKHWSPVLDLAMTELRVRDVGGRHSPLIGLPGRIGSFPDQGSHPGPLSFYLLAPFYRLFASTSYGLEVGAAAVNIAAAWTAVTIAARRGGRRLVLGVACFVSVSSAWFGASVLTQPWNPYLPLVSFVAVLLAAWAVADGDHLMLVPLVFFASLCAQTHVPYLTLSLTMVAIAFGAVGLRWRRTHAFVDGEGRSALIALGVAAVVWLPPFVDQIRHNPGNIAMLKDHFLDPPETPIGLSAGAKTMLGHFDMWRVPSQVFGRSGYFIDAVTDLDGGSWKIGAVVLLTWVVAAVASLRLADRRVLRLHVVVAAATVVGTMSAARIFGKVWYYLVLWGWIIALLAVLATVWTAVSVLAERGHRLPRLDVLAMVVLVLATTVFVRDAARVDPPEPRLSQVLNDLVPATAAALEQGVGAATGRSGKYLVVWRDAYFFGSQGYGLISELERRGFTAGVSDVYRVPVTQQRVIAPDEVTAVVILATGVNVAQLRQVPEAVEVVSVEPRSAAELREYAQLRTDAIQQLNDAGLSEVVDLVDTNLFGASLDPRLPGSVEHLMARMLVLGQETAVFIAPPGVLD